MNCTCYLCGSADARDVFVEDGVAVRRCLSCGHVYSGHEQDEHYDGYWNAEVSEADVRFWDDAHRPVYARFIAERLGSPPGRLVDVGCGLGFFVAAVRSARPAWDVHGYEVAESAVKWSHTHLGLGDNVHAGLVQEAAIAPGSVDVITMWDVVEHLPRPHRLLEHLRDLLAPGGILFMQTPNVGFQLAKARAVATLDRGVVEGKMYLAPRDHVNLYSRRSLTRLAVECGFTVPEFSVLPPVLAVGGRHDRVGEAAKVGLYHATRGLWSASGRRVMANPTLFAFLRAAA